MIGFLPRYPHLAVLLFLSLGALTSPSSVSAQVMNYRLETAVADIAMLKRVIEEQERRITELEDAIRRLQGSVGTGAVASTTGAGPTTRSTQQSPNSGWMQEANWSRVRNGMSELQVIGILGPPTSAETTVSGFRTLYYRGPIAGSGFVSGNVKLNDDRVWQTNKPVF